MNDDSEDLIKYELLVLADEPANVVIHKTEYTADGSRLYESVPALPETVTGLVEEQARLATLSERRAAQRFFAQSDRPVLRDLFGFPKKASTFLRDTFLRAICRSMPGPMDWHRAIQLRALIISNDFDHWLRFLSASKHPANPVARCNWLTEALDRSCTDHGQPFADLSKQLHDGSNLIMLHFAVGQLQPIPRSVRGLYNIFHAPFGELASYTANKTVDRYIASLDEKIITKLRKLE